MAKCPKCAQEGFPGGVYFEKEVKALIPPVKIDVDKEFDFWFIFHFRFPVQIHLETNPIGITGTAKVCGKCGFVALQDIKFDLKLATANIVELKKK